MGINDDQDDLTPEERRAGRRMHATQPAPKRQLPVKDVARAAEALKFASAVEHNPEKGEGESVPSVARAARDGFIGGFASRMGATSSVDLAIDTAGELEDGLSAKEHADRMAAYPELQGLEVNTGAAQQYPELAEERRQPAHTEVEEEGALSR